MGGIVVFVEEKIDEKMVSECVCGVHNRIYSNAVSQINRIWLLIKIKAAYFDMWSLIEINYVGLVISG